MNTIHSGNRTQLTGAIAINKNLESGFYDIGMDPMTGYFLEHRPAFAMPEKVYGDCENFSNRVLKTFSQLKKGMSVLLSGPKGCGKTMTAKKICLNSNIPVVCVSSAHCGEEFKTFLTNIPNPCVIFIDEFEKVYSEENQRNYMLSLLDGSTHNKHLFVLTSNSENIGEYFSNRPGRVRYHKRFEEFQVEALHEMIDDKVKNQRINKALHKYVEESGFLSPDVMSCLIEECLLHNEVPKDFKEYFNVSSTDSSFYECIVEITKIVPREGLSKEEEEKASIYSTYANGGQTRKQRMKGDHPAIESYKKFCETKTIVYKNPFCRALEEYNSSGMINLQSLYSEEEKDYQSYYLEERQINRITKKDGKMIIEFKENGVAILRKTKAKTFAL